MCGITGFFSSKQAFSETPLRLMCTAIKHRGPDADGFYFDGICGLGHSRLSIIDLSEVANQPMFSANERYVMIYNGEVYNYGELAKQIEVPLKTHSDSEVILELFSKLNLRAIYQFNGMFAIAIYDRELQELYLIRDRIGVKPIYYFWDEQNFAFASELKALRELPHISKELNHTAVSAFLHLGYVPAPHSIYKHIYKMAAGSWLKINKEGLTSGKYWDLREKIYDTATQGKLSLLNREVEAKSQLKKLLHSSVNYRLISDVPLGVFLSGGIDSSTVTAIATQESNTQVKTFSIGFTESKFNEAAHAQAVAKALNTNHHEFMVSVKEAQAWIPHLLDIYDEPFADSSAIPTLLVSKLARQHVTVVLGGDGGDELFLGYGMYQWANRLSQTLWRNVRRPVSQSLGLLSGNKYQKAKSLFAYPNRQELAGHIFSQEQHLFSRREIDRLLVYQMPNFTYPSFKLKRDLNAMEQQALFDLEYYLPDDLLVKVDRATMRFGLEGRFPLLDFRVIEFAINLHPDLKYHKGESKYLLKQVLYDYLPAKMFDRHKQGFAIPLIDWLRTDLKYLLDEYLNPAVINHFGLVKYEAVKVMKEKFLKGNSYYYNRLWSLIVLHQFLKQNF
jgi:asparagine synthase (glutamine-hydrolysing)